MKIGMDSMVLGAYVKAGNARHILDIGTGTGVLALMLAQKSKAQIDAIEIDEKAAAQAAQNAANSSWRSRIRVYTVALQDFQAPEGGQYDLILSNPPYFNPFQRAQHATSIARKNARSHTQLSFEELLSHASRLLAPEGRFYVVIPYEAEKRLIEIASGCGLFLQDALHIRSMAGKPKIRAVLGFGFWPEPTIEHELIVYQSQGRYTEDYKALTRSFHAVSFD